MLHTAVAAFCTVPAYITVTHSAGRPACLPDACVWRAVRSECSPAPL